MSEYLFLIIMAKVFYEFSFSNLTKHPGFEQIFVKEYNEHMDHSYAIIQDFFKDKQTKKRNVSKKTVKVFYEDTISSKDLIIDSIYTSYTKILSNLELLIDSSQISIT